MNRNISTIVYDSDVNALNLAVSQLHVPSQMSCLSSILPLTEATRYNDLLARLSEIAALQDNWDGYQAAGISNSAVGHARALLNGHVQIAGRLSLPDLFPTPHGTLAMEWQQGEGEAVLEIGDNGISGFVKSSPGAETYHITGEAKVLGAYLSTVIASILQPQIPLTQAFSACSSGSASASGTLNE